MDYVQMTMDDWIEIKDRIRKELNNVKHSFVRVGYYLRKVRDEKLYLQDGYSSLTEFAKAEFNMGASFVSRMISINEKFSLEGYSEQMDPRFEDFRQGALTEMLALPDPDLEMVAPEMAREDIRELKRFNAQNAEAEKEAAETGRIPENRVAEASQTEQETSGPTGDEHGKLLEVVEDFCRQNKDLVRELYADTELQETEERDLIDVINPSGSRIFKKGLYFISFMESDIKVKKFPQAPQSMTYQEFTGLIVEVMGSGKTGHEWEDHFGIPEEAKETEEAAGSAAESAEKDTKPAGSVQKSAESAQISQESAQISQESVQKPAESVRKETEGKAEEGTGTEGSSDRTEDQQEAKPQETLPQPENIGKTGNDKDILKEKEKEESQEAPEGPPQPENMGKTGFAPAQIDEPEEAFMNPPAGDLYDMGTIGDLVERLRKSIEERQWLTAEAICTELAAYLAKCRRGEEC